MSKWRKALKNKRRFDARYFLGEREEGKQETVENSRQQEKLNDFRNFSFDSWLTEEQDLEEAHCTSKRDDKVNEEDNTQTILDLIKQRIKEVGFGKETEEDFDAAKIELIDDYPDKEDEIDRITFDQFESSKRDDKNKMEEESTEKYDDDPALKGKQSDLPDDLQKAIIDKKRKNEIVGPQGKEPTFAPKPGEKKATGIPPHIAKILKDREDAKHLGPVPHDQHVKVEKNEG